MGQTNLVGLAGNKNKDLFGEWECFAQHNFYAYKLGRPGD